jgi:hypothetical protein
LNNKMMEKEQKVKINRNYKTQIVKKTKKRWGEGCRKHGNELPGSTKRWVISWPFEWLLVFYAELGST